MNWRGATDTGALGTPDYTFPHVPPDPVAWPFRVSHRDARRHQNPDGSVARQPLVPDGTLKARGAAADRLDPVVPRARRSPRGYRAGGARRESAGGVPLRSGAVP